jgi:hypothetical protein
MFRDIEMDEPSRSDLESNEYTQDTETGRRADKEVASDDPNFTKEGWAQCLRKLKLLRISMLITVLIAD